MLWFGLSQVFTRTINSFYTGNPNFFLWKALPQDTTRKDTTAVDLRFPFNDYSGNPYIKEAQSGLYLKLPSNISSIVTYDPEKNEYILQDKIGDFNYRTPVYMTLEEYKKFKFEQSVRKYWQERSSGEGTDYRPSFLPKLQFGVEGIDKVFGSNTINIIPQGSAELIFGINTSRIDNPSLSERLRKVTTFDFQEKIQMNVTGTIGDKMRLGVNYNTEATFDFENETKLEYSGKEDEIIKKIEAGNVTLPLSGSLITGSQSLFGLKTELQFGKLTVTNVFSQQRGETSVIEVKGGAQFNTFEINSDEYEANKHFFLSQYFRDVYNSAMKNLPVINSGVNIERIEIWVTNKSNRFEDSRNVLAFLDLAESQVNIYNTIPAFGQTGPGPYPNNDLNGIYQEMVNNYQEVRDINQVTNTLAPFAPGFSIGQDYEKIENARKLTTREYNLNKQLGYISLNAALNADQILAVAYEYTLNGKVYRVGEFSAEVGAPNTLIIKLIKGTILTPRLPSWDLMMKNVYAIGAYQVKEQDFELNILYQDDETGNAINYLPEGKLSDQILLQVLNLDNIDSHLEPLPDGKFDFISGITILPASGRIIFPVLEPFGQYLRQKIGDDAIADKYVFEELYDSTQVIAQQIADKNKFKIVGTYSSSSSSDIQLNALNVAQGSVKVTAGGILLQENVDYTVDYNLGRVKIINDGLLESQTPIRVSLESNQLFSIQTKTLLGTHLDYRFSENFNIGATMLNLIERPLTQKVSFGDEPISNTIWGINTSYHTESRFLTSLIDKIPFLETKERSSITFTGEFAHLIPGHSRAIEKQGISYIDDFEGSEISLDLKSMSAWELASTPQGQNTLFPEAILNNNLAYGYNRAKLAWYVIDPLFLRNTSTTPEHIKKDPDLQSSHYVREVFEKEIFPYKESITGIPTNLAVLNLAFYPDEKGPYNFDLGASGISTGINIDGKLKNPRSRWGGIMREVPTNDFEAANIQFIEFWLMDPYKEKEGHTGGELYFNLGNISEDILKDSRKSFENGLPTSPVVILVDTTVWGRIPITQSLVNAFDNDPTSRRYQDVGLDGLGDEDEFSFFKDYLDSLQTIVNPEVFTEISADPSRDNFNYFRGRNYDAARLGILDRYKNYNGLEGNSPTSEQSEESYPTTGSILPNVEDINRDNTLSESESYFQYRVSLSPQDMEIGKNHIIDVISASVTFANGEKSEVNWYQFRIPLNNYQKVIGNIQDFKSIRFLRMFLRGFEEEVILRFANLDLVRGEWRKYNLSLLGGGERITIPEPAEARFEISSVNIEENAHKKPVNYVLPPGISRVIDPTNPQLRQLNEQSIVLKVHDLEDGDAKAAFKNVSLDIRQYRRIQMFVHGEAFIDDPLYDGELTVFMRLGSDYKDNFYEYEIPLKLTPPASGRYNNDLESDRRIVWPEENKFDIPLEIFQEAKQARNRELRRDGSNLKYSDVFEYYHGNNRVKVSGNPNMSNIRTIMIGVRNPKRSRDLQNDDGQPKSGEVWLNELRLTDFNEEGGWAANARLQARLADFGTIDLAGSTSKPGWGSIEKKVNERSKEEELRYDISSNLELGKFFPEKANIRIPLYIGYSEGMINPQYNPLDPDILLIDAIENAETQKERDSIINISQDYTRRKSINLTNVSIGKTGGKPHLWNISNWSVSYSFNEYYSSSINTEIDLERNYRGGINYVYNKSQKNIAPLKKVKFLRSPALRLIRDFNFNLFPNYISFRTDLYRHYNEVKTRNINNPMLRIKPTFKKDFEWNRFYDVKYDITKSLRVDFSANATARIDEPEGGVDRNRYKDRYEIWKDSVLTNLKDFGRTTRYNHVINATYRIPINKLPFLNWVSATARYNATYNWDIGPVFPDTLNIELGNTIRNSNTTQLNGQLNMVNLYNKVELLKKINRKYSGRSRPKKEIKYETVVYRREHVKLKANEPRAIYHKLMTEEVDVKAYDNRNQEITGKVEVENNRKITFTAGDDYNDVRFVIEGKVEKTESPLLIIVENATRFLMGVRNVSISYSGNKGTLLPGFMPHANYMGMNQYKGQLAPGWLFIMGFQDRGFAEKAVRKEWLTTDTLLNTPFVLTHTDNLNIRSTIEPFNGLRIDLTANRRFSRNENAYFIANRYGNFPESTRNIMTTGNFSITTLTWGTAFEKIKSNNQYNSENFNRFKEYTRIISSRLAERREEADNSYAPGDNEYMNGYDITSQEVLIPAFLAAYSGKDPEKIPLTAFPSIWGIMPNWRITYDGLSRLDFVQKYFRSVSISHAYRSSFNIGAYSTNLLYLEDEDGLNHIRDVQDNFITRDEVATATINEQFSPLVNIDLNFKNSLTARVEIKKSRTLALSLSNNQITEVKSDELIIGLGYRFDEVQLIIRLGGSERELKSDLNLRADLSIRDNKTIIRKLIEDVDQPTAGQRIVSIKTTADYVLSDRFNLSLFFERVVNNPFVASSYPTANTNFGFSIRFTLAQ